MRPLLWAIEGAQQLGQAGGGQHLPPVWLQKPPSWLDRGLSSLTPRGQEPQTFPDVLVLSSQVPPTATRGPAPRGQLKERIESNTEIDEPIRRDLLKDTKLS